MCLYADQIDEKNSDSLPTVGVPYSLHGSIRNWTRTSAYSWNSITWKMAVLTFTTGSPKSLMLKVDVSALLPTANWKKGTLQSNHAKNCNHGFWVNATSLIDYRKALNRCRQSTKNKGYRCPYKTESVQITEIFWPPHCWKFPECWKLPYFFTVFTQLSSAWNRVEARSTYCKVKSPWSKSPALPINGSSYSHGRLKCRRATSFYFGTCRERKACDYQYSKGMAPLRLSPLAPHSSKKKISV